MCKMGQWFGIHNLLKVPAVLGNKGVQRLIECSCQNHFRLKRILNKILSKQSAFMALPFISPAGLVPCPVEQQVGMT